MRAKTVLTPSRWWNSLRLVRAGHRLRWFALISSVAALGCFGTLGSQPAHEALIEWKHFRGTCDASAMEMLDEDRFVAADDENNVLRIYSRLNPGLPLQQLDFTRFFQLKKPSHEVDWEGSARIGDRIYWISSHGANSKGKIQPTRQRLFATQVVTEGGRVRLAPVGTLYTSLLRDLAKHPELARFKLDAASHRPPKATGALNIEGLAATPEGHLLIGFRNPIPDGQALIVPLLNPLEVTSGKPAILGNPRLLDLQGLGLRGISPHRGGYLLVAGSYGTEARSRLFFWDGTSSRPALLSQEILPGNPEGVAVIESLGGPKLFALSDDGASRIDGTECKKLKDASLKVFRGYEIPFAELTLAK